MMGEARLRAAVALLAGFVLGAGGLVTVFATPASALQVITVTTNTDSASPGPVGSLRHAFFDASNTSPFNTDNVEIDIPASVGTITLGSGQVSYTGGSGTSHSLTVVGNGNTVHETTISSRVIGSTTSGTLTVSGLTITGGDGICRGAGIRASEGLVINTSTITNNTSVCGGGGVFAGQVTATNSTFSSNHATGGSGGGIETPAPNCVDGSVTLTNSTVTTNTAVNGGGGITAGGGGGGLPNGNVTLTNSTIDHNTASDGSNGDGGGAQGGGLTATNSTITNNTDAGDPGGGVSFLGPITLVYVTIASNSSSTGANIFGASDASTPFTSTASVVALPLGGGQNCNHLATTSTGYNWDDGGSCGFGAGPGDHSNAGNPNLGTLAGNGGSTQTRLPLSGSGLIDAIPDPGGGCPAVPTITTDQRGVTRPQGAGCDIGAVEVAVTAAPPPLVIVPRFTG